MGSRHSNPVNYRYDEANKRNSKSSNKNNESSLDGPTNESIELKQIVPNLQNSIIFEDYVQIFQYLASIKNIQNDPKKPFCHKFKIIGNNSENNQQILHKIGKKFKNELIVILTESEENGDFSIHWKMKKSADFIVLKHDKKLNPEAAKTLSECIVDFLTNSLNINHNGLVSKFLFQSGSKSVSLELLADKRDFNLLLIATEQGNIDVVTVLLQLEMNVNSINNKIDAQTIAFECQHFDVLNCLLQYNLKFPSNFDANKCTGKLKEFCELTENVHRLIRANEKENLERILDQNQTFRHFYNYSNESALKVAIESECFEIFDLLLSKKLRFGSHENPAEYYEHLDIESKRRIRDIQHKYSQPFLDKHIHTLTYNSTACYDETEAEDKVDYVQRAFKLLSENTFIKIILLIVAASKNFKIVFDFNREAVNVADPTTTSATQGIFYLSGKIYIGAKQLLNTLTEHETLAVLVHELCHFAMNIAYENRAKPYKNGDKKTANYFDEVSKDCEEQLEEEEVIDSVFECYPEEVYHAELIVRVVHLYALYRNQSEKLMSVRNNFKRLFEFYEEITVPELERMLPAIERRDEEELKIKDKKITKFKKIALIFGILSIVGIITAIIIGIIFYTPNYNFSNMSVDKREKIYKASVLYKNISVEFRDLFYENHTAYHKLTSNHIVEILNGKTLNFSDPHLHYLEELITHNWQNLTKKLKNKFLNSSLIFQKENLKFNVLFRITPGVFEFLNSKQIEDVLSNKKISVHKIIQAERKFYVKRKFKDENVHEINDLYKDGFDNNANNFSSFQKSVNVSDFPQNPSVPLFKQIQINNTDSTLFEMSKLQGKHMLIDSLLSKKPKSFEFDEIIKISKKLKLFILSSEAGSGKTASFQQFTMRLKNKFPSRWVSYIDLKDHKDLYKNVKTLPDVQDMLEKIFNLSYENEFEKNIFEDFFDFGNVILLWNGFDEISPDYSADVIRILSLIRNNTENIQFICTRPIYSFELMQTFITKSYTLVPFNKQEQEKFVKAFLIYKKVKRIEIRKHVEKVRNITNSMNSQEGFDTPLLLLMIAELILNDVEIYKTENLYEIYRKFVEKKIKIWNQKSEFARKFLEGFVTKHRQFDMLKIYQSYAMKSAFKDSHSIAYYYCLKLKIVREKKPLELTNDEISRMGILYINGPNSLKFSHKTFAEFFIAQFLIENIYNAEDEPTKSEALLRIRILYFSLEFEGVKRFLSYFLKTENAQNSLNFDSEISNQFITNFQNFFQMNLDEHGGEIFSLMFNFFKKDLNVLKKLLLINENETVYTIQFSLAFITNHNYDPILVKDLVKPYLDEDEFQSFIHGKNQEGVILYSLYGLARDFHEKKKYLNHESYQVDGQMLKYDDPLDAMKFLAKNLPKDEIKEIFKSRISTQNIKYTNKLNSTKRLLNNETWNFIENQFSLSDQKEILSNIFHIFPPSNDKNITNLLNFYLKKFVKYFSNVEILEIFTKSNILFNYIDLNNFDYLWNWFITHTTLEQQKTILKSENFKLSDLDPPINLLFHSALNDKFKKISSLYKSVFSLSEMKDILRSNLTDFIIYLISNEEKGEDIFKYCRNILDA